MWRVSCQQGFSVHRSLQLLHSTTFRVSCMVYEQCESLLSEIRVCEACDSSFVKNGVYSLRVSCQQGFSVYRSLQLLHFTTFRVSCMVYEQSESLLSEIGVCEECDSAFVKNRVYSLRVSCQQGFSVYRSLQLLHFTTFRVSCMVYEQCQSLLSEIRICEECDSSIFASCSVLPPDARGHAGYLFIYL